MTVCLSKITYAFQLNTVNTYHHVCIAYCMRRMFFQLCEVTLYTTNSLHASVQKVRSVYIYHTRMHAHRHQVALYTHAHKEEVCVHNKSRCALQNKEERKCITWHHCDRGEVFAVLGPCWTWQHRGSSTISPLAVCINTEAGRKFFPCKNKIQLHTVADLFKKQICTEADKCIPKVINMSFWNKNRTCTRITYQCFIFMIYLYG